MGVISNNKTTTGGGASAILTDAGEKLKIGDIVSKVDNKLYKVPEVLDTQETVLNFTNYNSNGSSYNFSMQNNAKILLVYANNSGYPEARLFTTGDNGVQQVNTTFVINSSAALYIKAFKISEEYVFLYYTTGGTSVSVTPAFKILKVTGNTVSATGGSTFLSTGNVGCDLKILDFDGEYYTCAITGSGYDSSITSYTQIVKINASTGTTTTSTTLGHATGFYNPIIIVLNSTKFIVLSSSSSSITLKIYTWNGTSLTGGTAQSFNVTSGSNINFIKIDDNRCYINYQTGTNTIKHRIITISGTTITLGTEYAFSSNIQPSLQSTLVELNKVLIVYKQQSDSKYYAKILTIANDTEIDNTSTAIDFGTTVTVYYEKYGYKYLSSGSNTYLFTIDGTNINTTLFTSSTIGSYTPFKTVSFTLNTTTATNTKATLTNYVGVFEPTGYVISDSRFVSNSLQKAAYIPF